jgi:phage virion morphogenesis protein
MTEGIQGIENLFRRIKKLATDTRHVERPLRAAGVLMLGSIEKNFKAQGRPNKWEKLADSTLARRRKGRGRGKAQILIDKGILKNSHSMKLFTGGVAAGTNAVQAKRQHFGFPEGEGPGHAKTPARPFVMFQEEDIRDIGEIFKRHIASR